MWCLLACGGQLKAEEGTLKYPLTESNYNHRVSCAWTIETNSSRVLRITFTRFNLETSRECQYDFLQVSAQLRTPHVGLEIQFCRYTTVETPLHILWVDFADKTYQITGTLRRRTTYFICGFGPIILYHGPVLN